MYENNHGNADNANLSPIPKSRGKKPEVPSIPSESSGLSLDYLFSPRGNYKRSRIEPFNKSDMSSAPVRETSSIAVRAVRSERKGCFSMLFFGCMGLGKPSQHVVVPCNEDSSHSIEDASFLALVEAQASGVYNGGCTP